LYQSANEAIICRFPIPDMRSKDDINRTPYWIRNLRNDSVVAQLQEFDFSTILNSAIDTVELETKCHEIRLFYKVHFYIW